MPKTYAVIGVATLYFFFIVFNLAGQLLTNVAGFAIPGYYSLEALFTAGKADDTQWLTVSHLFNACGTTTRLTIFTSLVLGRFRLLHVSPRVPHLHNALETVGLS